MHVLHQPNSRPQTRLRPRLLKIDQTSLLAPPKAQLPLVIRANFQLLAINNIADKDETFEFDGILTLKWNDHRLSFDPARERASEKIYQGSYQINEVFTGWTPQMVLINRSGLYETSSSLLRIQPDGAATLTQIINAVAKVDLSMRRLPFDHQRLEAIFGVFGFDKTQIELRVDPGLSVLSKQKISIDQWTLTDAQFSSHESTMSNDESGSTTSSFVVTLKVKRDSFFMIRLVMIPLALIVLLSWSVFWMDRSSMGDRINVCFVGILTAVAYQIVLGDKLPQISYMTFLNGFLNISFFIMSASVGINLVIGAIDKKGNVTLGDLIEHRCRWIFPITYVGLVLLALGVAFLFF